MNVKFALAHLAMVVKMTPSRPYLLKAYFDWLLDNDLTPHLVVNALEVSVQVPQEFVQNGQIVLNVDPSAVAAFNMDLTAVSFNARFGGVPRDIYIPMAAVLAIYARETGAGSVFEPELAYEQGDSSATNTNSESKSVNLGGVSDFSSPAELASDELENNTNNETTSDVSAKPLKKPTLRVIK